MPVDPMTGAPLPYPGDPMAAPMGDSAAMGAGMGGEEPQDSGDFAREMLDLINEWRQVEFDEEDLLEIEKISTSLQKLLARNSREAMDAMQGKLSPRIMAQAYGGS